MSGKVDAGRSEYVSNYNEREEVKLTETDVKQDSAQREELDTHDQYDLEYDDDDVSLNKCFSLCWKAKIITVEPIVFLYVFERYFAFLFSGLYYYQRFARDRLHAAGNYSITGEHFCINASYLDELLGEGTSDSVETNSTQLTLYVVLSGLVISIVSTIIIGPMTDSYGRKFALILVYVGRMFSELMALIIVYYSLDLNWFIVATVISSVFGDYGVFLMAITAYVTDISSVKMRLLRIGVLSLVSTISSGVTTVIGGTWINEVDCDFRSVVWGPFICCIIGILTSMFAIPESLSKDQRKLNRSAANNCQRLKVIWSGFMLYFRHKLVTIKLWIILFALLMVLTISRGAILIETYFFIRRPLEWSPEEIGLYGGYNSVTHGLGLLLLMPIAHAIGVSDVVLAIIGILSTFLGYLFTAGIKKTWHMFASKYNLYNSCTTY